MQDSFVAADILVISFFFNSAIMYAYVKVIFINQYLLNVVFSMTEPLNGQNIPKEYLHSFHLLMLFEKLCF